MAEALAKRGEKLQGNVSREKPDGSRELLSRGTALKDVSPAFSEEELERLRRLGVVSTEKVED